jgi:hypothetical protein
LAVLTPARKEDERSGKADDDRRTHPTRVVATDERPYRPTHLQTGFHYQSNQNVR